MSSRADVSLRSELLTLAKVPRVALTRRAGCFLEVLVSYIAVDLKVIEVLAPMVARGAGITEDRALAGLVRLWHRCWSTTSSTVTMSQLAGIFGGERIEEVAGALCADFLERTQDGFRVLGAERYLRLKAARRLGAEKTNAQRRSRASGSQLLAPGTPDGRKPSAAPRRRELPKGDIRSPFRDEESM